MVCKPAQGTIKGYDPLGGIGMAEEGFGRADAQDVEEWQPDQEEGDRCHPHAAGPPVFHVISLSQRDGSFDGGTRAPVSCDSTARANCQLEAGSQQ
jgi:hypothetical protein